jgi:hypothetical protein
LGFILYILFIHVKKVLAVLVAAPDALYILRIDVELFSSLLGCGYVAL